MLWGRICKVVGLLGLCLAVWSCAYFIYLSSIESLNLHVPIQSNTQDKRPKPTDPVIIGSSPDNIFTFIQISDVHISKYLSHGHIAHFKHFLEHELRFIHPELVLLTGDVTDAKDKSKLLSEQYQEEWETYYKMLDHAGVLHNDMWWGDLRGNHDCFNVPHSLSKENYFLNFSSVKREGFAHHLEKSFGRYLFLGLDACPKYGTSRPFNFFGYYDSQDMDFLSQHVHQAHHYNHTILASHYPSATTHFGRSSQGETFDSLSKHISVLLNGHLHRLFLNIGVNMFAHQRQGFLELELGDMKAHGLYRIMAIDHDFISFSDNEISLSVLPTESKHNITQETRVEILNLAEHPIQPPRQPIILVTHPKQNKFIIEKHEPTWRTRQSTHIRMLIYGKDIQHVNITINHRPHPNPVIYSGKGGPWIDPASGRQENYIPLWTSAWDPSEYDDDKTHRMVVTAVDGDGKVGQSKIKFRVDGKRKVSMRGGLAEYLLLSSFPLFFKDAFLIAYGVMMVGFLLIPKLFTLSIPYSQYFRWRKRMSALLKEIDARSLKSYRVPPGLDWKLKIRFHVYQIAVNIACSPKRIMYDALFVVLASFVRFCELSLTSSIFWPLFGWGLYLSVGPLFIGQLIPSAATWTQQYAAVMVYGMLFLDGEFVPLADSWFQSLHEVLYAMLPLVMYLSFCCTPPTYLYAKHNPRLKSPVHTRWYIRTCALLVWMYQLSQAFTMSIFYGPLATLLSPMKTWFVIWAGWALWRGRRQPGCIPPESFVEDIKTPLTPTAPKIPDPSKKIYDLRRRIQKAHDD